MSTKQTISIPEQIDQQYRKYALYVIQSRGIPNFYDCITPVQRLILQNAPNQFSKTHAVIGSVFSTGHYHHGDCFFPDTRVNLGDGTSIEIGKWADLYPDARLIVKCIDPDTGKSTISLGHSPRVGHITDEMFQIEMENGEIFKCTKNHPFLVRKKGWIKAEELLPNDQIKSLSKKNSSIKIKSIQLIKLDLPARFYDITVERYHNFCVGTSQLVVHNSSLGSAISKLARPFGCADQILEGDGFFGTPANPRPAGARYTQVKLVPRYRTLLESHKDLNKLNEEGGSDWLNVTFPIGLSTHIVGIAVGYSSNILPRKFEEVEAYLQGDLTKRLKPHFRNFKGKITRVEGLKSAWLVEGEFQADKSSKIIRILSLSPLARYDTFITKLGLILDSRDIHYKIENRSKNEVEITIKLKCTDTEFDEISEKVRKETQKIVTENIVLVKDGMVMEYESIQEYLDQFRIHREEVLWKRSIKDGKDNSKELEFQEAKLKFLIFMQGKKRLNNEIIEWLHPFDPSIKSRLESIQLIRLSEKEIESTKTKILELKSDGIRLDKESQVQRKKWQDLKGVWEGSLKSKPKQTSLAGDTHSTSFNGIEIWNPEEALIEEPEDTDEESNDEQESEE